MKELDPRDGQPPGRIPGATATSPRCVPLKMTGWGMIILSFFPSIFPCAILWVWFRWWLPLAAILVFSLVSFTLGRYCIRIEASPGIATERKYWLAALVVSSLFAVAFLALALAWGYSATGDFQYRLILAAFSLDAILFSGSAVSLAIKRYSTGTSFMIAGGVLSMPIGLVPVLMGIIARRVFKKVRRRPDSPRFALHANLPPETDRTEACPHCGITYSIADYDPHAPSWICSGCRQPLPRNGNQSA